MSKPARSKTKDNNLPQQPEQNSLSSVIDKVKSINSKTDVMHDDIQKTVKDIGVIASLMKKYIVGKNNTSTKEDNNTPVVKNSVKICKVYGCIYKGTYEGVVDGFKEVEKIKKTENDNKHKYDFTKNASKGTAKATFAVAKAVWNLPMAIRKALITSVAWEKSEVLSTFRAMKLGVGLDKNGQVDYAQKSFRLSLEGKQKGNLEKISLQEEQISILERISDSLTDQSKRERGMVGRIIHFGAKKDSEQLETLKNIDRNTAGTAQGIVNMRKSILKWMPIGFGLAGTALATNFGAGLSEAIGSGLDFGSLSGVGIASVIGASIGGLGMVITNRFRSSDAQLLLVTQDQLSVLKNIDNNTKDTQDTGFFGLGKQYEHQNQILRDIRTAVSPKEQERTGLAKMWHTFTKVPIGKLFSKPSKFQKTDSERTIDILERSVLELEHNTDYQEDILMELNRHYALHKMVASDGREKLSIMNSGVKVVPTILPHYTLFESENLQRLSAIEERNLDEFVAINELSESLCNCLSNSNKKGSSEDIYDSMELSRQQNLESRMGEEERIKDNLSVQNDLQTTVGNIYNLMASQSSLVPKNELHKGLLAKAVGSVVGGADIINDVAGVADLMGLEKATKVEYLNDKQIVSLSGRTMKRFRKYFAEYSDDDDFGGSRRRRKRKSRSRRGSSKIPKSVSRKGSILSKGKNLFSKGGSIASKGALATVPLMTSGLGLSGLLTSSGTAIAGAGVGAVAGSAGLVAGAGAIGYGIGSLINKGIDKSVEKITGGSNKSMGAWFYDVTHRKEAEKMKQMDIKTQLAMKKIRERNSALIPISKEDRKIEKSINKAFNEISNTGVQNTLEKGWVQVKDIDVNKALSLNAKTITGIGDSVMKSLSGTDFTAWQESANKGWTNTVNTMSNLIDGSDTLKSIRESKTASSLQQVFNDGKTFVQGGSSVTNINTPIIAHDTDRGTELLNKAYGA